MFRPSSVVTRLSGEGKRERLASSKYLIGAGWDAVGKNIENCAFWGQGMQQDEGRNISGK